MQTEFQEPDISIATRDRIFLDTKSVRSCSTLNAAEYQVLQSHGLWCAFANAANTWDVR